MNELIIFATVIFLFLIIISYIFQAKRKANYEIDLDIFHNECSCYKLGWGNWYSAPIIRHTIYEDFVVLNGKGENEKIRFKEIINITINPIFRFYSYFLKHSITYDYLSFKKKERRTVTVSTRNVINLIEIYNKNKVELINNTKRP